MQIQDVMLASFGSLSRKIEFVESQKPTKYSMGTDIFESDDLHSIGYWKYQGQEQATPNLQWYEVSSAKRWALNFRSN